MKENIVVNNKLLEITKFSKQNVGQCWNCKNCANHILINHINNYLFEKADAIPFCSVDNLYITSIRPKECENFEQRTKEYVLEYNT